MVIHVHSTYLSPQVFLTGWIWLSQLTDKETEVWSISPKRRAAVMRHHCLGVQTLPTFPHAAFLKSGGLVRGREEEYP